MHLEAVGFGIDQNGRKLELSGAVDVLSRIDAFADQYDRFQLAALAVKVALNSGSPEKLKLIKQIYERRADVAQNIGIPIDDETPPNHQYAVAGLLFPHMQIGFNARTVEVMDFTDKQKRIAGFAALNGRVPNREEFSSLSQDV